jgi:predicted glycoside hydrolase/deacetylase ChbG (UPF0249 family)
MKSTKPGLGAGLIVNADDLGIHRSINNGIFSAHRCGIVASAMLITTPHLAETIN